MSHTQRDFWEHEIPLIERKPVASSVQPVASTQQSVHRRSLSIHAQPLPHFSSATLQQPTKYSQLPTEDAEQAKHAASYSANEFPPQKAFPRTRAGTLTSEVWLPYTLRRLSLFAILGFNIALLVLVVILHWLSATRLGLGSDNGSSAVFFGWRFSPTLIAVIYVFCSMMLLEDVKRTEVFARLTKQDGASASASILQPPGPWWSTLWDSFPRRKNDHRLSWTMLCAVFTYILGSLIISPFSSALLAPKDVAMVEDITFRQVQLTSDSSVQLDLEALTYFQTIGHTLQNVTTSAWILDEYTVLPFWPASYPAPPFGATLSGSSETWKADTFVFRSELSCEPMTVLSGPTSGSYTYGNLGGVGGNTRYNTSYPVHALELASPSGCHFGFALPNVSSNEFSNAGGSFWSNLSRINTPAAYHPISLDAEFPGDKDMLLNHTSECEPGEVIIAITDDLSAKGQICRQNYYMGEIAVTAFLTDGSSVLTFDEAEFNRVRVPIDQGRMDIATFQEVFLGTDWNAYMVSAQDDRPAAGGPSNLLAALYNFTMTEMIADIEITVKASRIKQRAFGEALQASFQSLPDTTEVTGQIVRLRRRVVVMQAIAITLEVVLFLQMLLLICVMFHSHANNRSLGLSHDPAYQNTILSLLATQEGTQNELRTCYRDTHNQLGQKIGQHKYVIADRALQSCSAAKHDRSPPENLSVQFNNDEMSQWKPVLLSSWAAWCLAIFLAAVLAAVAVLYWISTHDGLYQSAFVYQAAITIGNSTLGTLAPYSIIPTLIAVIIGLWWGAIESVFRVVQPYVAMADGPVFSGRGSGLSYQSSYLVWATFRAARRGHWLLGLVCTGAFFSQIRESSYLRANVPTDRHSDHRNVRTLAARTFPVVLSC